MELIEGWTRDCLGYGWVRERVWVCFSRRLLILVSGWDLVMRVYSAVFLFLLFHTSNYCIAFFFPAALRRIPSFK